MTRVDDVWNEDETARLRDALSASDPEIGPRAAQRAQHSIDAYLAAWSGAYADTCSVEDEDLAIAQRLCLHSGLDQLRGVISVLEQADATIAANTTQILAAVDPVDACAGDLTVIRRDASIPELVFELAKARSLWHAGQPEDALDAALALAERSATAGDRQTQAEAWLLAGMVPALGDELSALLR